MGLSETIFLGATATTITGQWSITVEAANVVHTYTATGTDGDGNVGFGTNDLILGTTNADATGVATLVVDYVRLFSNRS
jgi:hypothetical protein